MAGIKTIITEFMRIAGHKIAAGYSKYLCDLVDEEIAKTTDAYQGAEYIDPFERIRYYLPNPDDAEHINVIRYLNACLITIAYNQHEQKYGKICADWTSSRNKYRDDVMNMYSLLTSEQASALNEIATPEELIILSVWNG